MLVVFIAVAGGAAVAVQGQFMGTLDRQVGTVGSVLVTYGGGGLVIALVALATRQSFEGWREVPWYVFTAGIWGLFIVGAIGVAVNRIGLTTGLTLFILGQLVVGAVANHLGLLGADVQPLTAIRVLGIALLVAGTWLVLR